MSPYIPRLPEMPVTHVPFWMWQGFSKVYLDGAMFDHIIHPETHEPGLLFAAACAAAYLGSFDNGYLMLADTREKRLQMFARWLPEDQFETVMAVAVPQRYREISASELEEMVRTGTAEDRPWAACWLALCGWFESDDCTFLGTTPDERQERVVDHIREVIIDQEEGNGWGHRISSAGWMYQMNGPPPLGLWRACLGSMRPGWVEMIQLVPARLLADRDPFKPGQVLFRRD